MRGAERREAHLGILRTSRRGAPLAKGARLSALHRGFSGLRGALLVSPYHLSVSERVAPGHNAEGPVPKPPERVVTSHARRAAPCSIHRTSPEDALDEQGGSSLCI